MNAPHPALSPQGEGTMNLRTMTWVPALLAKQPGRAFPQQEVRK